ncbi:hypothetical protein SAMN05443637_13038 [Pseudonocardia thermophila]|uniref:Uncharacterized protein n=1 Tax=Pseudonocardia thermophila TaxID=1848 RepID=A0A1M7AVZ0_PSETH|nr:hypothetical protein [Pseudonocardia thermophila]SHL46910.1 hypothetical protein SAMN05443637_13038 [Pseudonocardia thermophila]
MSRLFEHFGDPDANRGAGAAEMGWERRARRADARRQAHAPDGET